MSFNCGCNDVCTVCTTVCVPCVQYVLCTVILYVRTVYICTYYMYSMNVITFVAKVLLLHWRKNCDSIEDETLLKHC